MENVLHSTVSYQHEHNECKKVSMTLQVYYHFWFKNSCKFFLVLECCQARFYFREKRLLPSSCRPYFCLSDCLVSMQQSVPHWTVFHKILYCKLSNKSIEKFQICLKLRESRRNLRVDLGTLYCCRRQWIDTRLSPWPEMVSVCSSVCLPDCQSVCLSTWFTAAPTG